MSSRKKSAPHDMTITYHIILFDGNKGSEKYPIRDCKHYAAIAKNATYDSLITKIIQGLNEFKQYTGLKNYVSQHRKKLIIKIGDIATDQEHLQRQIILTNNQTMHFNDTVDIKVDKCVYLIGFDYGKQTKVTKPHKLSSNTKSNVKQQKNSSKKRKISDTVTDTNNTSHSIHQKPAKRRKKQSKIIPKIKITQRRKTKNKNIKLTANELENECLWVLTDATPSMNGEFAEQRTDNSKKTNSSKINKVNKVRECIESIATNNWNKIDCPTQYIALYSFGTCLKKETEILMYKTENINLLLQSFDCIELCEKNAMLWYNAIEELIHIITAKKSEIKCGKHRIVLFCGKQNALKLQTMYANNIEKSLKEMDITFDCIQIAHSCRVNSDLKRMADRYWSFIQDSVVLCHDFVYPNERNVSKEEAIVISDSD